MKKPIIVNNKAIGKFLKSMQGADFIYLDHVVGFRRNIERLIKEHELTKKDVCTRFKIDSNKYADFVGGNFNYSLREIATYNCLLAELEAEKIKKEILGELESKRKI